MYKRLALFLLVFAGLVGAADKATPPAAEKSSPQPVYIVLYSRFFDHVHQHITDERLQHLLPLLERLRKQYPQSGISALLQFSGTVSQRLDEENRGLHLVDQMKDLSKQGLLDIGYTGEDEPSYLYRPKANLLTAETPEDRWLAKADAAHRFLVDYKNPITGLPVPGATGGLKRTQEVFGDLVFASGLTIPIGADSPAIYELRKMLPNAVTVGIAANDPKNGIEGSGFSAANFSKYLSPDAVESPEMYWADNLLRLSDMSFADNRPHSADEPLDKLEAVFKKLDRSHVRVLKIEIAAYRRYLARRADGSVKADPMEWLYYHPDEPQMPTITLKPFVGQNEVEDGYRRDEETLKWLLDDFLPKNPGSRFVSIRDLAALAVPEPTQVTADQMKTMASAFNSRLGQITTELPNFLRAGDSFYSLAESFDLFANALGGLQKSGSLPQSVALVPMCGPLVLPNTMGPVHGSVPVSAVIQLASQLAVKMSDSSFKAVPANSVPVFVQVGSLQVNAAQFLHLMTRAYLDPTPDKVLQVGPITLDTPAAYMYPKNTPMTDQSVSWTYRPAPLRVQPVVGTPVAGAQ